MPTTIDLAAEYIQEWPDHSCIEDTARRGLADEDRRRLIDAYGDSAEAIATEIVRLCRASADADEDADEDDDEDDDADEGKTGWTWSICDPDSGPSTWDEDDETMYETADDATDAARSAWDDSEEPGPLRIVLQQWDGGIDGAADIRRL